MNVTFCRPKVGYVSICVAGSYNCLTTSRESLLGQIVKISVIAHNVKCISVR
jgi:hypothetical protein